MKPISTLSCTQLSILALLSFTLAANAVVVSTGGPNNTAPSGQPFFGNVGTVNGASAIYLGNQWVMSASHVASSLPASVNFGGTTYTTQTGSWQRLTNAGLGSGLSAETDIVLFRLTTSPSLPSLAIRTAALSANDGVMMIGNGKVQEASLTYWNLIAGPGANDDVWTEVALPAASNRQGFKTTTTNQVRWGTNNVGNPNITVNAGAGDVRSFSTVYDDGMTNEAQGVLGDSAGAVLFNSGGTWQLAGMIHAINTFENQPAVTAIDGQSTFIANLSLYAPQINAIISIPEASGFLLLSISTLGAIMRRKR